MKPRTLARHALKRIKEDFYTFDSFQRKREAIKQIKSIIVGKPNDVPFEFPITELHIGIYVPNFDYPMVPVDSNGDPIVWEEDGDFSVPNKGTHIVRGVDINGEKYYLSHLQSLSCLRNADVKVDRYTNMERAAHALICVMTQIEDKRPFLSQKEKDDPIKIEYVDLVDNWKRISSTDPEFETSQKKLYLKWLQKWISIHGRNPETHMRVLKVEKNLKNIEVDI